MKRTLFTKGAAHQGFSRAASPLCNALLDSSLMEGFVEMSDGEQRAMRERRDICNGQFSLSQGSEQRYNILLCISAHPHSVGIQHSSNPTVILCSTTNPM